MRSETVPPENQPVPNPDLPHILVLDAGFGGLKFCQKFSPGLARISVVDRQNHHLFQPLLYQVATYRRGARIVASPNIDVQTDD